MEIIVDMKQSDAKYGVNVDQLKSGDAATDAEAARQKNSGTASGTDAETLEDADDDAYDDDDMLGDNDAYDPEEDEEVEDGDHGSFIRNFYYGQIPQFVMDEFGLTPEIMEKNKA